MRPLAESTKADWARITHVLFDLDDTVLSHGTLKKSAFEALWALKEQTQTTLVAVTGRPAGWGDVIVRQWPIDALIAENGAIAIRRQGMRIERMLLTHDAQENLAERLTHLVAELQREVRTLPLADDNALRITDRTFDIGEHYRASQDEIGQAKSIARSHGASTLQSSIHLHVMFHRMDKTAGVLAALRAWYALDATQAKTQCAFIGDSENDASCFSFFEATVGVANISRVQRSLSRTPRFVTEAAMGDGFAEFAQTLVGACKKADR